MDLERLKVNKPCHEDWSGMQGDAKRRFCGSCNRHVHDLSAMTRAEAEAVCSSGPVCVRYTVDARGRMLHAGALLGLALSSTALASTDPQPDSVPWWSRAAQAVYDWWWPPQPAPRYEDIEERHVLMGDPAPVEELPELPPLPRPPLPVSGPQTVQITLAPGSPSFTSIEVKCEEAGFQQRAPFPSPGQGTATLPGVPGGQCRLSFKGGPFVTMPVPNDCDLLCSFSGTTPTCAPMER